MVHIAQWDAARYGIWPQFKMFRLVRGGGLGGQGYLRHLGELRGALKNTREYWKVLSYLSPLEPPSLQDSIIEGDPEATSPEHMLTVSQRAPEEE